MQQDWVPRWMPLGVAVADRPSAVAPCSNNRGFLIYMPVPRDPSSLSEVTHRRHGLCGGRTWQNLGCEGQNPCQDSPIRRNQQPADRPHPRQPPRRRQRPHHGNGSMPPQTRVRPSLAPNNAKARQLSHLHSQLAQLQAALADLEDITRVTAVQADNIKALGSLNGALYPSLLCSALLSSPLLSPPSPPDFS